jgi:hypothetical protein
VRGKPADQSEVEYRSEVWVKSQPYRSYAGEIPDRSYDRSPDPLEKKLSNRSNGKEVV